jgi:3-oxoacyl-[acyl-carrier-protein] synthase II
MTPVVITGFGVVSAVGVGAPRFFQALAGGECAIARDGGGLLAARVGEFGARAQIPAASLRRMPRPAQMLLVAAKEALAGASPSADATRIGVVVGTGLGTLDETISFMQGYLESGPEGASPLLFPSSVMNAAAGHLALELKLRGLNTTINHRDLSPLGALLMACDQLELGRADAVLCGAVDELNPPALAGYRALACLAEDAMRPYDQRPSGIAVGEGAAALLLEREADARARGAPILARLAGRGEAGEARARVGWGHGVAWPAAVSAVERAAGGGEVDLVLGGGNGSTLDTRELAALDGGLGGRAVPVTSILGATGEFMSSGLLRVGAALMALERQLIPPTVGCQKPTSARVALEARPAHIRRALVASCAQGGANAAVVLEAV